MKEIKAYIKSQKLDGVIQALEDAGVVDLTIIPIEAIGWHQDEMKMYQDILDRYKYNKIYKLEIVCQAKDTERFVKTIRIHAYTGKPGDGVIFVGNIEQAVKIRTGERGKKALE